MPDSPQRPSFAERKQQVQATPFSEFMELFQVAGFDRAVHCRFWDWRGTDFRGLNLRGFDFTGALLHGAKFDGALIAPGPDADGKPAPAARFDLVEIGKVLDSEAAEKNAAAIMTPIADLRAAADYDEYVRSWRPAPERAMRGHPAAGAIFQDAPFGPEMVVVPAGSFVMGSPPEEITRLKKEYPKVDAKWFDAEGPQREVTIAQPLAVGRFAVTFDEWDAAQEHPEWEQHSKLAPRKPDDTREWGRSRRPVIDVSWGDAVAYCAWLSALTGQTYRLLSEAEWEYAARAGTTTPFWCGETISTDQANYDGNHTFRNGKKGKYREQTVPVDSFEPNPWGLYQVHGNLLEWCADNWHETYLGAPEDGTVWPGGDASLRVLRGGAWNYYPQDLRSAFRGGGAPGVRINVLGFRVARSVSR